MGDKMEKRNYLTCDELKMPSLEALYKGSAEALKTLEYNINCLVQTEAPIALSLFNKKIRETLGVKKISQNAFKIIVEMIEKLGFVIENNDFDPIIWPEVGPYEMKYFRENSKRTIYQIEKSELKLLINDLKEKSTDKNELYHNVLKYLGFEVLTKKASEYLDYVVE